MDMMHSFVFGDIKSSDYGVYVLNKPDRNYSIKRDFENVSIPGRNRDIHIDHGRYLNTELSYQCVVMGNADVVLSDFHAALLSQIGYRRLQDSISPDIYYSAKYTGNMTVNMAQGRDAARFDITFERSPERFLTQGENSITIEDSGNIYNPTRYDARPLIRIIGAGTVVVNDTTIIWSGETEYVDIDCDMQECTYLGTNQNEYVEIEPYDFPTLVPGTNSITASEDSSVIVTPRWWTV